MKINNKKSIMIGTAIIAIIIILIIGVAIFIHNKNMNSVSYMHSKNILNNKITIQPQEPEEAQPKQTIQTPVDEHESGIMSQSTPE